MSACTRCLSPDQCCEAQECLQPMRAVPHINFEFVYPPIPIRSLDWQATLDGYEGGDPIGRGATKGDAMIDLIAQLEEAGVTP